MAELGYTDDVTTASAKYAPANDWRSVPGSFKHVPTKSLPHVKQKKRSDPFPVNMNGLLSNFLAAVDSKNYAEAAALGKKILGIEPDNSLIKEYLPVLEAAEHLEEGDESATETSTASDSESDDWSDTEEDDGEEEEEEAQERDYVQNEGDNNSNIAATAAPTPCMAVTCSDTFAFILQFCASNEIAGRFSSVCDGWSCTIARNDTWREIFRSHHQFEFDQFELTRAAKPALSTPLPSSKEQRLLTLLQRKQQRNALSPAKGSDNSKSESSSEPCLHDWRYLCLEKFRRTNYSLRGLDDIERLVRLCTKKAFTMEVASSLHRQLRAQYGTRPTTAIGRPSTAPTRVQPPPPLHTLKAQMLRTETMQARKALQLIIVLVEEWIYILRLANSSQAKLPFIPFRTEVRQLPLAEIEYWKLKYKMFERLYNQCNGRHIRNAVTIAHIHGRPNLFTTFDAEVSNMKRVHTSSKSNMQTLEILRKPFLAIADGKMQRLVTIIPSLCSTLKLISQHQRFYNCRERLEPLIMRISQALSARVSSCNAARLVCLQTDSKQIEDSILVLTKWHECCHKWASVWSDYSWDVILDSTGFAVERCAELLQLVCEISTLRDDVEARLEQAFPGVMPMEAVELKGRITKALHRLDMALSRRQMMLPTRSLSKSVLGSTRPPSARPMTAGAAEVIAHSSSISDSLGRASADNAEAFDIFSKQHWSEWNAVRTAFSREVKAIDNLSNDIIKQSRMQLLHRISGRGSRRSVKSASSNSDGIGDFGDIDYGRNAVSR